jgi:hypothetical protein
MQYVFYFLAPFAFFGSAEFRGLWIVAVLRALLRLIFVFGLAFYFTWLLVKQDIFVPPKPEEVARQVCLVTSADRETCPPAPNGKASPYVESWLAALETQGLHHVEVVEELKKVDKTIVVTKVYYRVQPRTGENWSLVARLQSSDVSRDVTLLTVEPTMVELPALGSLWSETALFNFWTQTIGLDWPFRTIQFQASPYVLSSLVLRGANPDISTRDSSHAKSIMDSHFDAVPGAASAGFVWPRRLNGPVHYASYLLFLRE